MAVQDLYGIVSLREQEPPYQACVFTQTTRQLVPCLKCQAGGNGVVVWCSCPMMNMGPVESPILGEFPVSGA